MTNKEKYADKIIEIAVRSKLALKDGKPIPCTRMRCSECGFFSPDHSCRYNVCKWLDSECVAPPVDWSKVAVDTPILVRNSREEAWTKRHFAKYENGTVYAWSGGRTSWIVGSKLCIFDWKFAKLAESEEKND